MLERILYSVCIILSHWSRVSGGSPSHVQSSNRLVFHSTGTSRTPDSQTPGSRTAVHVLMGEKRKKCLERRNLAEKHDSSLFLWNPVLFEFCSGSAHTRP
ncbi:hypothetical protein TNCV_5106681 [Trichonephila clavipes]|uniref:Secreted protein n=1 Tax=Trichonephila clavipes TaxID=2585209 RepID=A0A8X6V1A7_TRICX|nr:hypothetical protein TNCV_5106681 [Trichonephila clavipes]